MADLRYKVVVDDAEAKRKLSELLKGTGVSSPMGGMSEDAKKATASIDQVRAATIRVKEAQEANIKALRQARLERAEQIKNQAELNARYKQGQIDMQEFRKEQAKLTAEEKKRTKEARELKKALAENSEYSKLTKALNNVRKETKDVLAEMYSLERQGSKNSAGYQELANKARGLTAQTKLLDQGVKKIDATVGQHQRNVGNYASAMDNMVPIIGRVNMQLANFGTSLDSLANQPNAIKELGVAFVGMGKSILAFVATPVGAAIAGLATLFALFQRNKQTVIDFDSGMKNVSKTTGMAGADLTRFGDAIVDLSMKLQVVSADKLLEYATVAGQLGVKGREDILAFTEALAMLETASDIKGEEGGREIARLLTLVDGGVRNVKDFGDEIVNLGNNFAATEAEILANATRIAQSTGIYKIGRQEVLAYATATKSVGVEAELVGSTIGRTLGILEKVIRTGKGVDTVLKLVGGTQAQLSSRFRDDASGVLTDFIGGLSKIEGGAAGVNKALSAIGISAIRDRTVLGALATNGYDVLTSSLENVRDANGAMQEEFENGASKLEQQTKRMSIAWDNFVLSIENGEGAIGRSVVTIVGFFATIFDELTRLVKSDSWGEFFGRVGEIGASGGGRLKTVEDFKKIYSELKKASEEYTYGGKDFSLLNDKQLKEELDRLETLKNTAINTVNEYEAAILSKRLKERGTLFSSSAGPLGIFEERQKEIVDAYNNLNSIAASRGLNQQSDKTPNPDPEEQAAADEKAQRAAERAAERRRQAVERQRALQLQINGLNEQSLRGQLSRDQQEVASIRDKYKKIREEVRKFYSDPKNSGLKVNMSGISNAESFEISEATTRQETTRLVKQLNEQKALYDEYNGYVREHGVESAEKMFEGQLEAARGYRDELQREYGKLMSVQAGSVFGGRGMTQAQNERAVALRAMLAAMQKDEEAYTRQQLANALKAAETLGQGELRIRKKYNDAVAALGKQASEDQLRVLRQSMQEEITALVEATPEFKRVMDDIDRSSQAMLGNAFRTGKETIFTLIEGMEAGTIEERAALKKMFGEFFDRGAKEADLGNLDNVARLASGFGQLVEQSFQFKGSLDGGLGTLSDMVGTAGQLAKGLSNMLGESGGALGQLGGYAAILGGVLSFASGLSSLFNRPREARNAENQALIEASNQRQLKATEAMTKALQMQLEIIEEIYGTQRLEEYERSLREIESTYRDLNDAISGRYLMTGDSFTNDILQRLNNGETQKQILDSLALVSKEYRQASGIFQNLDRYARLTNLPKDIEEARASLIKLQREIALNGVDDHTQSLIDQLEQQIDLYEDTMNKLREERTGNSFASLLSDVTQLFLNEGADAAEAWTDGFDKVMENYMVQKFSRDYLQEKMQGWYNMLDDLSEDGLTVDERDTLAEEWDKIRQDGQDRIDQMREILGLEGISDQTSNLASEGIQRITEETGTELVGMARSIYDINKQQLLQLQSTGKSQIDLVGIATSQLRELNSINTNTANTVVELKQAVVHLQNIDTSLGRRYVG